MSFHFNFGCLPTPIKNNYFYGTYSHNSFKIKIEKSGVTMWSQKYKYETISPYTIKVKHKYGTSFLCTTPTGLFDVQYISLDGHKVDLLEYKRESKVDYDRTSPFLDSFYDIISFKDGIITKNGYSKKIEYYNPYSCYVIMNSKKFIYIIDNNNHLHEIDFDNSIEKIYLN